jgi:hypothetical protein
MPPFCALCTGPLDHRAVEAPLGKNDAMVTICHACDQESPRQTGPRFNASTRGSVGVDNVGEGNRKRGGVRGG